MLETLSVLARILASLAVITAVWQLILSKRLATTKFEDSLAKECRDIAANIPVKALLDETRSESEYIEHFDDFYRYFDLCNQQVYLHQFGRISRKTWAFWKGGIVSNLERPAFAKAWNEGAERSGEDFSELRSCFPPKELHAGRQGGTQE